MINMKRGLYWIVGIIAVILLGAAIYFSFFYSESCNDSSCFNNALLNCKKVGYIEETSDASWGYDIRGRVGDTCKVSVKLLQLKQGDVTLKMLQGEQMNCYIPYGSIIKPQANIDRCHGILKEDMQSIMINKLHNYITDNLGQIEESLRKVI